MKNVAERKIKTLLRNPKKLFLLIPLLTFTISLFGQFPAFPPDDVDNLMDRDQMVNQLGIIIPDYIPKLNDLNSPPDAYPSDASDPEGNWTDDLGTGNTVQRSDFLLWNNYHDYHYGYHPGPDSVKAGDYTAIDLLKMNDGTPITDEIAWGTLRRPELFEDVQNAVWGVVPHDSILPDVSWNITTTQVGSGSTAYIQKEITGVIDISRYPDVRNAPQISATLRLPVNSIDSVPVMVVIGSGLDTYWDYCNPNGWGVCIFNPTPLQPDNGAGLTSYLIGLCNKGNWRKPGDWGTLAAWGWGISKLVDYFETDTLVDATKIGVTGHSRYGKAALVTMAYDERMFIAFPSDAGALGTAMNRRHYGQNLENCAWDQEYHWVAGNFFNWMGELTPGTYMPRKIENMPVDAHSLMALCAPRPVYTNGGTQSTWIDPYGVYLTSVNASPVYELLGATGIVMDDEKPVVEKAYIDGDLAYRYHEGGHTDVPDWPDFWIFSKKYIDISPLNVSPNSIIIADTVNSVDSIIISTNGSWTLTVSDSWLSFSILSGSGDTTLEMLVEEANTDDTARFALLTISVPGLRDQYVQVNQVSPSPDLSVSVSESTIADTAGSSTTLNIISNTAWNVSSSETWLSLPATGGINNGVLQLVAQANSSVDTRQAEIVVSSPGLADESITVTQEGGEAFIQIADFDLSTYQWIPLTEWSVGAGIDTSSFYAQSNDANAVFDASESWLTISSTFNAEYQFHSIELIAEANPASTTREAIFSATATGLNAETMVITQDAGALSSIDESNVFSGEVFPNPFTDIVNINFPGQEYNLKIIDMQGKVIFNAEVNTDSFSVDMSGHSPGMYLLQISTGEDVFTTKLFKSAGK